MTTSVHNTFKSKERKDLVGLLLFAIGVRLACVLTTVFWYWVVHPTQFKSNSSLLFDNESLRLSKEFATPFVRWDAIYFVQIAQQHMYTADFHHAFFPGYPLTIRLILRVLRQEISATKVVWTGVLVSNVAFVSSVLALYKLAKALNSNGQNRYVALVASVLYTVNPASVFLSSVYTESLFSCCSLWAFVHLHKFELAKPLNLRKLWHLAISLALFMYATTIRSNGMLNAIPFAFCILRECSRNVFAAFRDHSAVIKRFLISCVLLGTCAAGIALILAPYHSFLGFAYKAYCLKDESTPTTIEHYLTSFFSNLVLLYKHSPAQLPPTAPSWCAVKHLPNIYHHVQRTYWNTGFFKYWILGKLDRFLISIPIYSMAIFLLFRTLKSLIKPKITATLISVLFNHVFGHLVHLIVIIAYIGLFGHVEVIVRLLTSCPLYFIALAQLVIYSAQRQKNYFLTIYLLWHFLLASIGPFFFALNMTWT